MATKYYFHSDRLDSLLSLLSTRPTGEIKILIGGAASLPGVLEKIKRGVASDRDLVAWLADNLRSGRIDIRAMEATPPIPEGLPLPA
jgi:hypothetical protein